MKKPEGEIVNLLELPEIKGEGNSTRTMEIAKADKEMLKGIGADPEKFTKIFKVLKVFNISSELKRKAEEQVKDESNDPEHRAKAAEVLAGLVWGSLIETGRVWVTQKLTQVHI